MGVTRTLGLPIFHQVHEGNVHDTKMFNAAISKFSAMNIKSGLAVFDRGITSAECISKLSKLGWKCLAGVQNHKGVKAVISDLNFERMQSLRNLVVQGDTKFFAKSIPFTIGTINGKLIILQNSLKKQRILVDRLALINEAKELMKSDPKQVSQDLLKFFNKDGGVNRHAIDRVEKFDGLSFLFTNSKLSVPEAISYYFEKDLIERCFRLSKSVLKLRPIRLMLDNRIRSHIMICYIGLALLTTVRLRMKKAGIYRDPGAALRSLDSIFKIYLTCKKKDGRANNPFHKVNTLSNQQHRLIRVISPNLEM